MSVQEKVFGAMSLTMLGDSGRTDYDDTRFPVHRGWNDRDVRKAGVCDYVGECGNFIM